MFYEFIKWYFGWMMKLHYRRVYTKGTLTVPDGEPVIYASNHPAGFVEPMILTTNVKQSIHFLVLGSFMKSPWFQWFFKGVKMVPIFRMDITGLRTVEKNVATFGYVYEALKKNAHILIYPEALTNFIYKVRPLKKGIARMTYGFMEQGTHKHMYIVPVGVNFLYPAKFRSDVFLEIGEAIKIDDISGNERSCLYDLIKKTSAGMKKVVYDLEDESRQETVQQLLEMQHYNKQNRPDLMVSSYTKNPGHVDSLREYVEKINQMPEKKFENLKSELLRYKTTLKRHGLIERSMALSGKRFGLKFYLLLIFGLPLFLIGMLLNGFSLIAAYFVKKNMVKRIEYKAGVSSGVPTVLILVAFIVFMIIGFIFHWGFCVLALLFPLSMYFLIYYYDLLILLIQRVKLGAVPIKELDILKSMRTSILNT